MRTKISPLKSEIQIKELDVKGDHRGCLVSIEGSIDAPFEIKRVYYIFGTKSGIDRGKHAHINLQQLLVCVSGSCTIKTQDARGEVIFTELEAPNKALLISGLVWREMLNFSDDAVLVVLADGHYDEADYIRDFNDFLQRAEHSQILE